MTDSKRVLLTGTAGAFGTQLRKSGSRFSSIVRFSARAPCENLGAHEDGFPVDFSYREPPFLEDAVILRAGDTYEN